MSEESSPSGSRRAGPDFLGIGAQKSGTTWLYENLKRHPGIGFPADKEIHFWDRDLEKGVQSWLDLFVDADAQRKLGEITPAYAILDEDVVHQIAALIPQVRLFYSIRNPIERAWSSALMALERAEMTFDEASDQWFIDHFESSGSRRRGNYVACLDRWTAAFPAEQLHVILFDDIVSEPRSVISGVARHIGVDLEFYASIRDEDLAQPVFAGTGEQIRPQLYRYLEAIYAPDIEAIETRLKRDLADWRTVKAVCA